MRMNLLLLNNVLMLFLPLMPDDEQSQQLKAQLEQMLSRIDEVQEKIKKGEKTNHYPFTLA